ncbi:MAG: 4-hydroxy-tetrahydrodipicolinate reductase [Gammaproteobacteria bacterium]|nr:4-hydroxy-tetrahydrodipicolinate reductase [Gammaproteobacteria bacterium]
MISVAICGATGRMGRMLIHALQDHSELRIGGALASSSSSHLGSDVGLVAGCGAIGVIVTHEVPAALNGTAVAIDFSTPTSTMELLDPCVDRGIGMVVGTTGFTDLQQSSIQSASQHIPVLQAPNMSVGVNVSLKMLELATKALGNEFDVEIHELHHRNKVDSPSGTALQMGQAIAHARESDLHEVASFGREGIVGERVHGEIGFHSSRGGDVVGEHTVTFAGIGERIELTHRSASRSIFAAGALRGSVFIARKAAAGMSGLYDMSQVLGLP